MKPKQFKLIMQILIVIARAILNNANVTDSAGALYSEIYEISGKIE